MEETSAFWNGYFSQVRLALSRGHINTNGGVLMFPSMLLLVKAGPQYIAELIGVSPAWRPLAVKRLEASSAEHYFNQFPGAVKKPTMVLNVSRSAQRSMVLANDCDLVAVAKRFPQITGFRTTLIGEGSSGGVVSFGPDFDSNDFEHCMFVNAMDGLVRCKFILQAFVIEKRMQPKRLNEDLQYFTKYTRVAGVHTVAPGSEGKLEIAGHLQSLYLSNPHETAIGDFLRLHEHVLKGALDAQRVLFEPTFDWIERLAGCEDDSINPDLLVLNKDGRWDIYDLKKALIDRKSITRGELRRRRFLAPIYEGVSQLAHYRQYFAFAKNAEHALQRHGVVIDRPRLVLVVGNLENVVPQEVEEAKRGLDADLEIIDYDTLCSRIIGPASGMNSEQNVQ